MTGPLTFAMLSFSALFVMIDPVGNVPIFVALTPNDSPEHRREMVRRAIIIAWCVLISFAMGGAAFFQALGITPGAFKVAGGLLLLITALDQLRAQRSRTRTTTEEEKEGIEKDDISVVPLAIPFLAGPGSMVTSVMLMGKAHDKLEQVIVLVGITVVLGICFVTLSFADGFARMLRTTGRLIAERLGGLVLAAIAVQFILDGAAEVWRR